MLLFTVKIRTKRNFTKLNQTIKIKGKPRQTKPQSCNKWAYQYVGQILKSYITSSQHVSCNLMDSKVYDSAEKGFMYITWSRLCFA